MHGLESISKLGSGLPQGEACKTLQAELQEKQGHRRLPRRAEELRSKSNSGRSGKLSLWNRAQFTEQWKYWKYLDITRLLLFNFSTILRCWVFSSVKLYPACLPSQGLIAFGVS